MWLLGYVCLLCVAVTVLFPYKADCVALNSALWYPHGVKPQRARLFLVHVSGWWVWWWGCGNGHTGACWRRRSGPTPSWSAFEALSCGWPPAAAATRKQTPMATMPKGSSGMPACLDRHRALWCSVVTVSNVIRHICHILGFRDFLVGLQLPQVH